MEKGRSTTRHLYLRTIRSLQLEGKRVRNVDVARELGYSRPSVTAAMKRLRADGLVSEEGDEGIRLTASGMDAAERSETRSAALSGFFERLGVEASSARDNAARIEHLISDDLYDAVLRNASGQTD